MINSDPISPFREFFPTAELMLREIGVSVRVRTDFGALLDLNERHRHTSWSPLIPTFDPRHSRLNIEDAYWVEAVDRAGNTVATQATKLFDWRETNLADEIRSLRPFFADPAPHLAEGSRIDFKDQGAHAVSGIVVAGGAVWVHPHYRRTGVALVVPKISRAHAYARWPIAGNWAVMEPKTLAQGFAEEHRLSIVGSLVFHLRAWRVDLPCYALWTLRTTALGDLARMIDQAKDTSRRLLTPPTIPV